MHPITFVNMHLSVALFLSPSNSESLYLSVPHFYFALCGTQFLVHLSLYIQLHFSLDIPYSIYISHSLTLPMHQTLNISIPVSVLSCLYLSMSVSSPSRSLFCCSSFFCCLSLFVSVDMLVSLRAALWHGEMELVVPALTVAFCSQDNNSRYWRRGGRRLQGSQIRDRMKRGFFKTQ